MESRFNAKKNYKRDNKINKREINLFLKCYQNKNYLEIFVVHHVFKKKIVDQSVNSALLALSKKLEGYLALAPISKIFTSCRYIKNFCDPKIKVEFPLLLEMQQLLWIFFFLKSMYLQLLNQFLLPFSCTYTYTINIGGCISNVFFN